MANKFALISSTGASVIKKLYEKTPRGQFGLDLIIVDRDCGAKNFGISNGIKTEIILSKERMCFSDDVLSLLLKEKIDYVYVFFTRLLAGELLKVFDGKLFNFHPSILPACPGMHGFEDTVKSGAMMVGSTVHFIDDGMDTGKIVLQGFASVHAHNPEKLRHIVFAQQCASLLAVHKKLNSESKLLGFKDENFHLSQGFLPNIDLESLRLYKEIAQEV